MKKSWVHSGTVLIRVSANHFAFLRGYLEGLELAALSRRYLETSVGPDPELRVARSTLRWIREQLMVAARRRGQFPDARLILIDPEKLRQSGRRTIPSLEEFREERDPHEMFSEAELLELFEEEFGGTARTDRKSVRNERLRRRQLHALGEFERLLGTPPGLDDDVSGWLDPGLAKRLKAAGLNTLGELVATINGRGFRWWIHVPRFGEKAAAQVVAWLKTEAVAQGLGVTLGIQASVKASRLPADTLRANRPKQTAIVPLEHLLLPPELDGSRGRNRAARCGILARNDLEAVSAWLATKPAGSATWRSYRKEAERFLLWSVIERQRPMSSLSAEDCSAYRDFLRQLSPDSEWTFRIPRGNWCGARGTKRWSTLWRPFEGGLSVESRNLAITILGSMCRWLVKQGYLASNPWSAESLRTPVRKENGAERGFSAEQWELLLSFLDTMSGAAYERLRFLLPLCRATGLRLSELVHAKVAHLHPRRDESTGCELEVPGRNREPRGVALPPAVLSDLDRYLATRGLGDRASCDPRTSLIGRLPGSISRGRSRPSSGSELSPNALYQILKRFFSDAADWLEQTVDGDGPDIRRQAWAAQLRVASTEWLRRGAC